MKHIYIYIIGSADFGVVGGGVTLICFCILRQKSWEWTVRGDPAV